eukprot:gene13978-14956_t
MAELDGRECPGGECHGPWDSRNVETLLHLLKDSKASYVYGLELGNEDAVGRADQISDYKALHELMSQVWPQQAERPLLFGPATNECHYTAGFLNATKDFLAGY